MTSVYRTVRRKGARGEGSGSHGSTTDERRSEQVVQQQRHVSEGTSKGAWHSSWAGQAEVHGGGAS